MAHKLYSFWHSAQKIYIQKRMQYELIFNFSSLSLFVLFSLKLACLVHTILTMLGHCGLNLPYSVAHRISLAWLAGCAFASGMVIYHILYLCTMDRMF